jgi:hypothetical protein
MSLPASVHIDTRVFTPNKIYTFGLHMSASSIQMCQNKNSGTNGKNGSLRSVTIYQAYDIRSHRSLSIIATVDTDKLLGISKRSINYC